MVDQFLSKIFKLKNYRKMLIIAIVDALTTEVYIDLFMDNFRISVSVIILPIFYYFNRKVNPVICSFFVGTIGIFFRGIISYLTMGNFIYGIVADYNIFIFDIFYGLIYYFFFFSNDEKSTTRWVFTIFICDFFANAMELFSRFGALDSEKIKFLNTLFFVALIRSLFAIVIILVLKTYRRLLKREEHEERYRSLLTFISDLKGEVYFMKNNMEYIETVMGDAYKLFESLDANDSKNKELSLEIAKDVHEIKKNYYRVITGIEQISKDTSEYNYMGLHDLFTILETSLSREIQLNKSNIEIVFNSKDDVVIKEHYMIMSILRNLIGNSIEALDEKKYGKIEVNHLMIEDDHIFTIIDNGNGIKKKDLEYIFDPGYSTKFNKETGDIYRGLGLTLVKDIVEKTFNGKLYINSIYKEGTRIEIVIPKKVLEV